MLVFIIVEKLSSTLESNDKPVKNLPKNSLPRKSVKNQNGKDTHEGRKRLKSSSSNSINNDNNNNDDEDDDEGSSRRRKGRLEQAKEKGSETKEHYHISGYLNLMANSVDNFTHGLAIGGSFSISFKMGVLSTFAILVHELPHEIGDFAILLK